MQSLAGGVAKKSENEDDDGLRWRLVENGKWLAEPSEVRGLPKGALNAPLFDNDSAIHFYEALTACMKK